MRKDPFGFYEPPQSYESSTLCYYAHHTTSVGIKGQGRFVTEIQNFTVKKMDLFPPCITHGNVQFKRLCVNNRLLC